MNVIMEMLVAILVTAVFVIIAYVGYKKQEKLMRDGRPIMAKIVKVRPVSIG